MKKALANIRALDFFLSILMIVFFFWIFLKYTVNVPINDDYSVLHNFNGIINTDSFLEKLRLIFAQHNEHRIVYDRIWFIINYEINNQIDFNFLSLIGNLSLIGLFFLFVKRASLSNEYFVVFPISVLLFNLTFYENMTFSMAALSNFTVVLFSLLSLSFLTAKERTNKRFILAIAFCFLAIYTQGGGLFVVPVSLLILFLQKDYERLKYYGVFGVLFLLLYFIGYENPISSPSILESFINFKMRSFLFSLAFLGNAFSFSFYQAVNITENQSFQKIVNDTLMLNAVVGFAFISYYSYLLKNRYYNKNLFNFSVMTLVIVVSIVTGITRSQLGIETAFVPRYRILSVIFLITVFITIIEYAESKKIATLKTNSFILFFSILYFFNFSYSQEEYLYDRKKQILKGVLNYYSGNHKLLYGFEQDYYKNVLENSRKSGTYYLLSKKELEKNIPYSLKSNIDVNGLDANLLNQNIDEVNNLYDSYYIEGFAFIEGQNTKKQEVFVGISNQGSIVFYSTQSVDRYDLNSYFKNKHLENGGFYARIKNEHLALGENKISIYIENKGIKKIVETSKTINK
jgi:hypothetical protein